MTVHKFSCIDAHTCGNPVRLVAKGGPQLQGDSMSAKRQDFLANHDWVRTALMFEPRGHAMMSGSILYPPNDPQHDGAILFIETSGCLPMCGHGTIGTVTTALQEGLWTPKIAGQLTLEVPAGVIRIEYQQNKNGRIDAVRIFNVASYLAHQGLVIDCPELGQLVIDVAYGGNYYAIIEPQANFAGLEQFSAAQVLRYSPLVREAINKVATCVHPEDASVNGISHVMWTGKPSQQDSSAANAVFYGSGAIDRSPCGTGTSARMAQLHAKGLLKKGEEFIHESIIGSQFVGRVESTIQIGPHHGIMPSVQGWAQVTGYNTIIVDPRDPYAHGFEVN
ncbi:4-hydroxyproline epimerase [Oceanospirillaceae bacterium]|nr:4-hydroxyproline epimerase [Oceanospirillaceae bacterium]MDB4536653.1 4-hydroxyproline epimerase [Oceanospirillaceae bacterium]MDC1351249.1 4-hydroxyproline epimerase [Oceanospirillaceae bacterium]MDC1424628.1 4-hydroxyproline epimerase [Oceanospirillaceae bacterium]